MGKFSYSAGISELAIVIAAIVILLIVLIKFGNRIHKVIKYSIEALIPSLGIVAASMWHLHDGIREYSSYIHVSLIGFARDMSEGCTPELVSAKEFYQDAILFCLLNVTIWLFLRYKVRRTWIKVLIIFLYIVLTIAGVIFMGLASLGCS